MSDLADYQMHTFFADLDTALPGDHEIACSCGAMHVLRVTEDSLTLDLLKGEEGSRNAERAG